MMPIGGSGILIMLVTMALAGFAQLKVKGAYAKWSKVGVRSGITGAEIAQRMMQDNDIDDVGLECIAGQMTDHYDPKAKMVRLSQDVFYGNSVASLGIAAHEIGHVIQHARGYTPMHLRSFVYPAASIGSKFAPMLILAGIFIQAFQPLIWVGVWLFAAATAFTVVTLPVEFDASKRALATLNTGHIMEQEELAGAKSVLSAAALTYVAAAITSVLYLLHYIALANRRG